MIDLGNFMFAWQIATLNNNKNAFGLSQTTNILYFNFFLTCYEANYLSFDIHFQRKLVKSLFGGVLTNNVVSLVSTFLSLKIWNIDYLINHVLRYIYQPSNINVCSYAGYLWKNPLNLNDEKKNLQTYYHMVIQITEENIV